MLLTDQLLLVADTYAEAAGIGRKRVSTIVLNRGATLDAIAEGRADVTTGTFEKAMLWFSANWPAGRAWPQDVVRPHSFDGAVPHAPVAAGPDPQAGTGHLSHDAEDLSRARGDEAGAADDLAAPALSIAEAAE